MTADEFRKQFKNAHSWKTIVYHRGYLPRDKPKSRKVRAKAQLAWRYGCPPDCELERMIGYYSEPDKGLGLGVLTAKRLGPYDYEYRITKLPEGIVRRARSAA